MNSWKITFNYDYLGPEHECGQRDRVQKTLTRIIVCDKRNLAVAHIENTYGHADTFKVLVAEAGPEIDAIISVNHGLGPVNR